MSKFHPNEIVELKGERFRIAATNHEGKLILHPAPLKESTVDMMIRLQSTRPVEPDDLVPPKKP